MEFRNRFIYTFVSNIRWAIFQQQQKTDGCALGVNVFWMNLQELEERQWIREVRMWDRFIRMVIGNMWHIISHMGYWRIEIEIGKHVCWWWQNCMLIELDFVLLDSLVAYIFCIRLNRKLILIKIYKPCLCNLFNFHRNHIRVS